MIDDFPEKMRCIRCGSYARFSALFFLLLVFIAACGNGGGGSNWPTEPIESAIIVDAQNIWLTTDKAELIYLNEGAMATKQLNEAVAAADFINSDVGWSLMKNGVVLQTRDHGTTWKEVGKVQKDTKGKWPFWTPTRMIKFTDENIGWIAASTALFRTEDGGRTWKDFYISGNDPISEMVVVDRNEFWCITWFGIVFHTLDGGFTWTTNELPSTKPGDESYPRSIARDTAGRIWVGNLLNDSIIYVTNNKGQSWDRRTFPTEPGNIRVTSIQFAPDGTGWLVYRQITETDSKSQSYLMTTTDSGETWVSVPGNSLPFAPVRVAALDSLTSIMVGESDIAITIDGGATWKVDFSLSNGPIIK